MLILLLGTNVPGDEGSRERKFLGTKVSKDESSTYGTFVPRNESSRVQKFHHINVHRSNQSMN